MRRNLISALLCCAVILMVLSACGSDNASFAGGISSENGSASSSSVSSEEASLPPGSTAFPEDGGPYIWSERVEAGSFEALYYPLGKDGNAGHLLFSQSDNLIFRLRPFPEKILDQNGNSIAYEDLKKGNLLRVDVKDGWYNAEAMPRTIDTACRVQVIREGSPEDAEPYREQVNYFFQPQIPPALQITYEETFLGSGIAVGSTFEASEASYEWSYEDVDGVPQRISQERPHPLLQDKLAELELAEPTDLELSVRTEGLEEFSILRWDAGLKGREDLPEGESTAYTEGEHGSKVLSDVEPGWVYQVTARWEQGWVSCAFETVSAPVRKSSQSPQG